MVMPVHWIAGLSSYLVYHHPILDGYLNMYMQSLMYAPTTTRIEDTHAYAVILCLVTSTRNLERPIRPIVDSYLLIR
jgi:hypothetical protein